MGCYPYSLDGVESSQLQNLRWYVSLKIVCGIADGLSVGTSYQLGNLVSSASSTIEATIGERFPLDPVVINGVKTTRYNYGIV